MIQENEFYQKKRNKKYVKFDVMITSYEMINSDGEIVVDGT